MHATNETLSLLGFEPPLATTRDPRLADRLAQTHPASCQTSPTRHESESKPPAGINHRRGTTATETLETPLRTGRTWFS
jgi:hypothetical protein